jgi:hypothetical protein
LPVLLRKAPAHSLRAARALPTNGAAKLHRESGSGGSVPGHPKAPAQVGLILKHREAVLARGVGELSDRGARVRAVVGVALTHALHVGGVLTGVLVVVDPPTASRVGVGGTPGAELGMACTATHD